MIFRAIARFCLLALLLSTALLAQKRALLSTAPSAQAKRQVRALDESSCPNQGGILNSISVPVNQPLTLYVYISEPSDVDENFDVSSLNNSVANAGDATEGFSATVTIPAGEQYSNAFTVIGNKVGQTFIQLASESGDYSTSETPIGPWTMNHNGQFFVDANPPAKSCLIDGTAEFSTNTNVLSTCGAAVAGVETDGVTQLLLRAAAGIPGTACFAISSSDSSDYQGSIQDFIKTTEGPASDGADYAFTYYTPPAYFGNSSDSRSVDMTFTFTPSEGNGNTTTLTGSLTVVRPPVLLLHGIWSGANTWIPAFKRNNAFYTTYPADYGSKSGDHFSVNEPMLQGWVKTTLNQFRGMGSGYAGTQVDVIAHSMGGILTRMYADSDQFQRPDNFYSGDIRRLVTLDTPHKGSSFANLAVSLHQALPFQTYWTVKAIGDITQGAVCDLAENSPALKSDLPETDLPAVAVTGTGGPIGQYIIGLEQISHTMCAFPTANSV